MAIDRDRLERAYATARDRLLDERHERGHWVGCLATSALSTATAVSALALIHNARAAPGTPSHARTSNSQRELEELIQRGTAWLLRHQNDDGGWGDTELSYSNIATTMLCRAALHLAGVAERETEILARAERYIEDQQGVDGLRRRYGRDKTFAVPILANCALAGLVPWRDVSPLPFELACLPQSWYRFARLPVVSYAIPALVAIGQARFLKAPPWLEPLRWIRRAALGPSLRVLRRIQPESGGYLEAIPLTSFVVMSLAGTGRADHEVARAGEAFLRGSIREDGSWPIDTNLATWNTSLAIRSLTVGGENVGALDCWEWLLNCQNRSIHPFTGAEPGGWGWSDLSGSVPDADDTPAALLALNAWRNSPSFPEHHQPRLLEAVGNGLRWLMSLQNRDGGWPTFCRGWGKLPFDRSGCDLTAHALRACLAWQQEIRGGAFAAQGISESRGRLAVERGFRYLENMQRTDGAWLPLWFGNQDHPDEENRVYGTSKVLLAFLDYGRVSSGAVERGLDWLLRSQNPDGGWSSGCGAGGCVDGGCVDGKRVHPSSVEETSLAVETLAVAAECVGTKFAHLGPQLEEGLERGVEWLMQRSEAGEIDTVSPIGFYFAKLWYYESLYPITFCVGALGRARRAVPLSPLPNTPTQPTP